MEYSATIIGAEAIERKKKLSAMDAPFALITVLLLCTGVIMVLSASFARAYYDPDKEATYYFTRQLFFALSGLGIMYAASRIPIDFYRKFSAHILIFSAVMLLAVLVAGTEANGAKRWFSLAGRRTRNWLRRK